MYLYPFFAAAYDQMVDTLVCTVTDDFREHYVWRKVPKDQAYADVRD